ncbi:SLBB domain-containing protein [Roseiarcus fermentans]|uniref:SLBB domain-containing protein n=1 Tax=Roseiarcus fermentans TaxID=1473586 RepID=A0A366EXM5_9HYPH|nr:SLBB domain-containing protein [Roseiarcus fermentans]RBP07137.1 SLBB domain-containing protein [Roseiarcus fermentans]
MHSFIKASTMALVATVGLPSVSHDGGRVGEARVGEAQLGAGLSPPAPTPAKSAGPLFPTPDLQFPGGGGPEAAQPAKPQPVPAQRMAAASAVDRAPAPSAPDGGKVERGDKLKLGFFETVDLGGAQRGWGDPQGGLRTFYQRMDLSGEYLVEGNGGLSVPLLGEIHAAGRDLDDLRSELAASFAAVTGRSARIDARIVDRAPVYVVGPVRNPGAVHYAEGLFVLQAVALAGGLGRGADNPSTLVEGAREMERLRLANLQLDRLTARRARLEAQRGQSFGLLSSDGAPRAIPIADDGQPPPPGSAEPPRDGQSLGAAESAILQAEQARRRSHEKELAARIDAARNEVEAIKAKLDQFEIQREMRAERLDTMQKLKDRGVDTSDHILTLRTELADIEARRQDCRVTLVEAEARLAQAEDDSGRDALDYTTDLAKEIAAVDKDIAEAREAAGSAESMATILSGFVGPGAQPHYEILREGGEGVAILPASETSPLKPGDVLKVK